MLPKYGVRGIKYIAGDILSQCSHVFRERRNAQIRVNLPLTASPSALIARLYMTLPLTLAAFGMPAGNGPPYRTDELRT